MKVGTTYKGKINGIIGVCSYSDKDVSHIKDDKGKVISVPKTCEFWWEEYDEYKETVAEIGRGLHNRQ